jgi:hypothetical protein
MDNEAGYEKNRRRLAQRQPITLLRDAARPFWTALKGKFPFTSVSICLILTIGRPNALPASFPEPTIRAFVSGLCLCVHGDGIRW